MSGYQVTTPDYFNISQPSTVLVDNVSTLNATYTFPSHETAYNTSSAVEYSADALLGGYIIRDLNGSSSSVTDHFQAASTIITKMKQKLNGLTAIKKFINGTSIRCTILNRSNAQITLESYGNSIVSGAPIILEANSMTPLQITVATQTSLGGVDTVFISIASSTAGMLASPTGANVYCSFIQSSSPALGPFNFYYNLTWDSFPNASSYQYNTDCPGDYIFVTLSPTGARLYTSEVAFFNITIIGNNDVGSAAVTVTSNPCFLAGSLVAMANGSFKKIEDVQTGEKVIGAFGEINTVLALHRPILNEGVQMCSINGEHSTTSHHPHISADKQFYSIHPAALAQTYGRTHTVLVDGQEQQWMLHGLRADRVKEMQVGHLLKTLEGHRTVQSIEILDTPVGTQLYNLVVDGSHSYHVDGYAVTGWPREDDFDYDSWTAVHAANN